MSEQILTSYGSGGVHYRSHGLRWVGKDLRCSVMDLSSVSDGGNTTFPARFGRRAPVVWLLLAGFSIHHPVASLTNGDLLVPLDSYLHAQVPYGCPAAFTSPTSQT